MGKPRGREFSYDSCRFQARKKSDRAVLRELKEKLILAGRILDMEDLVRPLGHITVRVPGTETFLITRGVSPGMATVDDVLVCDMDGNVIEGKYSRTFGEVLAHAGVYRKRKDIRSVAHTHSWNVMALSMTETTIVPASFESIKVAYEPVALYKKVSFLDNLDVTEEIADLIGPNRAVILKGHGAIVVGKSIEEALFRPSTWSGPQRPNSWLPVRGNWFRSRRRKWNPW